MHHWELLPSKSEPVVAAAILARETLVCSAQVKELPDERQLSDAGGLS